MDIDVLNELLLPGEEEEGEEKKEEFVDWHAILVQDYLYSDPSEEDISSGDEILSGSDIEFEDYGEARSAGSLCKY